MPELEALKKDVAYLKLLFQQRESTHFYLQEVLRIRNQWQKRVAFAEFKELAAQIHHRPLDARIAKKRVRILIELTCAADIEMRSRYSAAISNAHRAGCKPAELSDYFRKKGGIEKAAYGQKCS